MAMIRKAKIERRTKETNIFLEMTVGSDRPSIIDTTLPFFDHMLALFAKHGGMRLILKAKGDTHIDDHHLVEDIGICLGLALNKALDDKRGIMRYGWSLAPMDETLCAAAIDISGRPYLVFNVKLANRRKIGSFDPALVKEFFKAFSDNAGVALHINLEYGSNTHHIVEGVFKAVALALKMATLLGTAKKEVPSTKGRIG